MQAITDTDEVQFGFDELFFSRTDEHGIIQSGNSVFRRVSCYSWEELLKKPHKVIRHPDMPRAVFWLFWDTIKQQLPIGAYVKNRAKDGRHYWVFAIATPIQNGYLSVRLKPSSPVFEVVKNEYAALLAREAREQLRPAESAALLLARLKELGFADYNAFMSAAITSEIDARRKKLAQPADHRMDRFVNLTKASQSLIEQAATVFKAYSENAHVSLNFQVQAAQLGQSGAAIGEISRNYDRISSDIRDNMQNFVEGAELVAKTVSEGQFLLGAAQVQEEVVTQFRKEGASEGHNAEAQADTALLEQQMRAYRRKASDGLDRIAFQAKGFQEQYTDMKRLATGLEVTRIMGKVESARLSALQHGLGGLIDELENLQRSIANGLKTIEQLNQRIMRDTAGLIDETRRAA